MKQRKRWTEASIESELFRCMEILKVNRMPSAKELNDIGRNDLCCQLSKTKKFKGWAEHLNLPLKRNGCTFGNEYEINVKEWLENKGYRVEKMTSKHPYDLLVNGDVKVDVKCGGVHFHFGTRAHTFRTGKKKPTCDLYVCVSLDEYNKVETVYVIPSKFAKVETLNVRENGKYKIFLDKWDYVKIYDKFYKNLEVIK